MIDIHHHCIPGVDDGPRTLAEAVDLCGMAAEDGIETIIATPHVLRGRWQNDSRPVLEEALAQLREAVGPSPRLILGSEYFFDYDIDEVLARGTGIIPLAGSRYVLVEFDANSVPPLAAEPLYRAQLAGWTAVIAHPERNATFHTHPELLEQLVARGTKTQITAGSLLGEFGPEAKRDALRLLKNGLVHFVASDAHNTKRRPPRMKAAAAVVREVVGEAAATGILVDNPEALLQGHQLPWDPDVELSTPEPGILKRLGALFRK